MFENIILPILVIIGGFFYLRWLYKIENGFFKINGDLFSKSVGLFKGWILCVFILIVGICFLIKGILKYF